MGLVSQAVVSAARFNICSVCLLNTSNVHRAALSAFTRLSYLPSPPPTTSASAHTHPTTPRSAHCEPSTLLLSPAPQQIMPSISCSQSRILNLSIPRAPSYLQQSKMFKALPSWKKNPPFIPISLSSFLKQSLHLPGYLFTPVLG